MWVGIISLFPEMFLALHHGITGRAITKGLLKLACWNPRQFATNRHNRVDDRPYGGGPGMVMQVEPLLAAINAAKASAPMAPKVLCLTPQGQQLTQDGVKELARQEALILVAGRYEGIDERLQPLAIDGEWSIGDYVLSGGELAAMVVVDAIVRTLPEALGDRVSAEQDSFSAGLLDYPHYTRPEIIAGLEVPKVLLQGDHKAIASWRLKESLGRTWLRRPDLLINRKLSSLEQQLLQEFIAEYKGEKS